VILPASFEDALSVASKMRAADRRELGATQWSDDFDEFIAHATVGCAPTAWCAHRLCPIGIVGAAPKHPNTWQVFMYATDDFPLVGLCMTRFIVRAMIPALVAAGARRAECYSIEGHTEAHRWLELLGATREATLREYGRGGEDFHVYRWLLSDVWKAGRSRRGGRQAGA
jgi:hypothetical protein